MKNKLSDLNNHLFAQLERLSNEDLKGDELKEEIERSKAVKAVAQEIISCGKLALEAQLELGGIKNTPEMLEVKNS
ncbi:TPA: hypothetical protein ACMDR1_001358 [Vibrio cholerae]